MSNLVEDYYNSSVEVEWSRLDRHPLEFEIAKKHIDQFLKPSSRILDVGGGPGRYAFHYAGQGHRVTILDLSPGNVAFATKKQLELGVPLERVLEGNATSMPELANRSFDFILCRGQLYHLVDAASRNRVLAEYRRVLEVAGAEGLACQSEEALRRLGPREPQRWVEFLFRYSEDPTTWGANQHVICVAEKNGPWEKTTPR